MKIATASRLALPLVVLSLPLAMALRPAGTRIAFAPEASHSVTKSCVNRLEMTLDDLTVEVDGQEIDASMLGDPEVTLTHEVKLTVEDVYLRSADGRPLELKRTFSSLGGSDLISYSVGGESGEEEMGSTSEFDGKTVVFTWNPATSTYECALEGEESDAALTEDLEEDLDLRLFLPQGEVAAGDSWEIAPMALAGLLAPGGDLRLLPDGSDADMEEAAAMFEELDLSTEAILSQLFQGKIKATLKQLRKEGDVSLAEIEIEASIKSSNDFSDLVTRVIDVASEGQAAEEGVGIDDATVGLGFEGKGVLVWNLSAGRAQSFELAGDAELSIDLSASGEEDGESHSGSLSAEASGTLTCTMTFEE